MINLYEILEVSENASKEVIEKAYRVLAKKYHPDLQKMEDKHLAEEKMKQINDAYDTLIDEEKRNAYDRELEEYRKLEKQQEEQRWKNEQIKQNYETNIYKEDIDRHENIEGYYGQSNINEEKKQKRWEEKTSRQVEKEIAKEVQNAYAKAYNDYWRSRGYKIKQPWTWKRVLDLLKVLLVIAIILVVIWFFPPTHNLLVKFYEENTIIQTIVNILMNIIKAIGNGLYTFFTNLFKF